MSWKFYSEKAIVLRAASRRLSAIARFPENASISRAKKEEMASTFTQTHLCSGNSARLKRRRSIVKQEKCDRIAHASCIHSRVAKSSKNGRSLYTHERTFFLTIEQQKPPIPGTSDLFEYSIDKKIQRFSNMEKIKGMVCVFIKRSHMASNLFL